MEAHGIEGMIFMPLSYIERGYLSAEELAAPDREQSHILLAG
jgi:hypothetical protein